MLLERESLQINFYFTYDGSLALAWPPAPIVRLAIEQLNLQVVLTVVDIESEDLIPHWIISQLSLVRI